MLITENVELFIKDIRKSYYINMGYLINDYDKKIVVKTKDLPIHSKTLVIVECGVCGEKKEIPYKMYTGCIKRGTFFTCCEKCTKEKIKKTCIEKYGCENPFGNK